MKRVFSSTVFSILKFMGVLFIGIVVGYFFSPQISKFNLLKPPSSEVLPSPKYKFPNGSLLDAQQKDTGQIEVREVSFFGHQGKPGYRLNILIERDSYLLPEMFYLVEKSTQLVYFRGNISLSRFQKQTCQDSVDSSMAIFETEFFTIDQDLPFPKSEPALKRNFQAVVVYQDNSGKRYYTLKDIEKICTVFME